MGVAVNICNGIGRTLVTPLINIYVLNALGLQFFTNDCVHPYICCTRNKSLKLF